jgi:hypothetical protein
MDADNATSSAGSDVLIGGLVGGLRANFCGPLGGVGGLVDRSRTG